jgi:adenylosuccinate lyase
MKKPYEALKALTRTNEVISQASIKEFILNLQIGEDVKNEMLALTPQNYTGI